VKLRKQVVFTEEAWTAVEDLTNCANDGFHLGHVSYSDTINAMILSSRTNAEVLRAKHKNVKRTLKAWVSKKEVDIDSLIKDLTELKGKAAKKRVTGTEKEVL
jgi:hypothetical protein